MPSQRSPRCRMRKVCRNLLKLRRRLVDAYQQGKVCIHQRQRAPTSRVDKSGKPRSLQPTKFLLGTNCSGRTLRRQNTSRSGIACRIPVWQLRAVRRMSRWCKACRTPLKHRRFRQTKILESRACIQRLANQTRIPARIGCRLKNQMLMRRSPPRTSSSWQGRTRPSAEAKYRVGKGCSDPRHHWTSVPPHKVSMPKSPQVRQLQEGTAGRKQLHLRAKSCRQRMGSTRGVRQPPSPGMLCLAGTVHRIPLSALPLR